MYGPYLSTFTKKINQMWANRPHIDCLGMGCHFVVLQYCLGPPWSNLPNSSTSSPEMFEFKKSASHHLVFMNPELVIRNQPCAYVYIQCFQSLRYKKIMKRDAKWDETSTWTPQISQKRYIIITPASSQSFGQLWSPAVKGFKDSYTPWN